MEKPCVECGKVIQVKPSHYARKKYCSRTCKTIYQKRHPPVAWQRMSKNKVVECNYCRCKFIKKQSEITKNNFCSKTCRNKHLNENKHKLNQHLKKQVQLQCLYCEKMFSVIDSRKSTAKYCSRNCLGHANGQRGRIMYTKRVLVNCTNCCKQINKKPSTIKKWNFCGEKCMGDFYTKSKRFSGSNNGAWQGGDLDYYGPNWRSQRRKARERDNFQCQDCGISEEKYGRELSVHHINPFRTFNGDWKQANQLTNLVSLCEHPCHRKRHILINKSLKFSKKPGDRIS